MLNGKGEYWYRFVWWMYCRPFPMAIRVVRDFVDRWPIQPRSRQAKILFSQPLTQRQIDDFFLSEASPEMRKAMMFYAATDGPGSDVQLRMAMLLRESDRMVRRGRNS